MKALFETFFTGLGVSLQSLELKEEAEDLFIDVKTPDSALLIGMHGKNIEPIQHLLSRIAEKQYGKYIHVHLEVNDYMKAKEERLFRFLDGKIEFVLSSGKMLQIKSLSPYERKKAHNYIAERHIEWLSTKSEWEGENRVLILTYTWPLRSAPAIVEHKASDTRVAKEVDLLSEDGVGI